MLSREDVDQRLVQLGEEHEAIETSLLSLQDHAGRRLLEGAQLTGSTRTRWKQAERTLADLWFAFNRGTEALVRAREVRSRRRNPNREELAELTGLLLGEALVVPGSGQLTERVSWESLVHRMNTGYAEVLDVVAAADAVWSTLPPRTDLLAAELQRLTELAHSAGVRPGQHPAGDHLEGLHAELNTLREEILSDPLAFWQSAGGSNAPGVGSSDISRFERTSHAAEDVRREVDAVLEVRKDAETRLTRLRDMLNRAERTLTEARSARGEVLAKIAASEVPPVRATPSGLHEQLALADGHRRQEQWHRLAPLLDSLEERAEEELERARASLTSVTAPLAFRAELRGRLDAYRAKANRLSNAADPQLSERYDRARWLLWTAPCDLRAAEDAVLRYQQAADGGPAAPGPERGGER